MFRFLTLSLLAISVAIISGSPIDTRIIGGEQVDIKEVPFQAIVIKYSNYSKWPNCGAVIISPGHVLTAAHCVV